MTFRRTPIVRDVDGTPLCTRCGFRLEKPETHAEASIGGEFDDALEADALAMEPLVVECVGCGAIWKIPESVWPIRLTTIG